MTKMRATVPGAVLVAKPNAGLPELEDGRAVYRGSPAEMAEYARLMVAGGARIVGGCCGSAPEHLRRHGRGVGGQAMMTLPERVTICEVGPRDGFQIEPEWIPTETKVEVIDRLSETGLPRIEVTSFVHPKVVPQMRDAEEVMARIRRRPGTQYVALVPNEKGAVRAVDAGVDAIHTVVSASESHNLANVNMTVAESLGRLRAVLEVAARARVPVSCAVSTSFGCPFEGDVPVARLEWVVRSLVDMGARSVALADTTGMANPRQVTEILERFVPRFPGVEWTLHTHDTRALAIPNILAAMACGVTHFDSSIGGLGGCPFAPGASGNVCTEDLVHGLHAMGVQTGIDLDRLLAVSRRVQEVVGRVAPGPARQGRPRDAPLPGSRRRRRPPAGRAGGRRRVAISTWLGVTCGARSRRSRPAGVDGEQDGGADDPGRWALSIGDWRRSRQDGGQRSPHGSLRPPLVPSRTCSGSR